MLKRCLSFVFLKALICTSLEKTLRDFDPIMAVCRIQRRFSALSRALTSAPPSTNIPTRQNSSSTRHGHIEQGKSVVDTIYTRGTDANKTQGNQGSSMTGLS